MYFFFFVKYIALTLTLLGALLPIRKSLYYYSFATCYSLKYHRWT